MSERGVHWRQAAAVVLACLALVVGLAGCGAGPAARPTPAGASGLNVLAVESFLADIAQNVAGDRATVGTLVPIGVDPHGFEPVPADVARVAKSDVLISNGAGLEVFLARLLANAGGERTLIEASAGLTPRQAAGQIGAQGGESDPHFWLDPNNVETYVANIRDGLTQADPAGASTYAANADAYIARLKELDAWIRQQVEALPASQRVLVTNHDSLGYFADRYGFTVDGTILDSTSSLASPSAQQLAQLVDHIRASKPKAVFLETGDNQQLARQVASETAVKVVTDLYEHSITKGPPVPTYIDMIKHNVESIVTALR
jgi:ABC-type Zn uptake system ZnuABC Zn-binding protein ZnuA